MIREIYADKKALECLSLATNRHEAARNRLPLFPQHPTFWMRSAKTGYDPQRKFGIYALLRFNRRK